MKEKIKPFIRIGWQEAFDAMKSALREKYKSNGEIFLRKDYGYDGVGDFYDEPTYVDIEINNEKT